MAKEKLIASKKNFISALRNALRKRRGKKTKTTPKEKMYKIKGKVDEFMKAAFEPKSMKMERKRKQKIERQLHKAQKTKSVVNS